MTGHAYAIIDAFEIDWDEDIADKKSTYHRTHRLLRIKNPWGHGEWKFKWSESEGYKELLKKYYNKIQANIRER